MYRALREALSGFCFATAGEPAETAEWSIDRIAHTRDVELKGDIRIWPRHGVRFDLSDHTGVQGDFALRSDGGSRRRS